MFTRLAKFRRLGLRHLVPHGLETVHSNDTRGRRRPTGQRRSPQPVLACHWIFVDGRRLECRWQVENLDETSVEEPGGRQIGCPHASPFSAQAIRLPRVRSGSRRAALQHCDPHRDFSRAAMTTREPDTIEEPSSGAARLLAAAIG